jgi:hypothetical protein
VDVSPFVARLVLAQCVEGYVRVGQVAGGRALEVAHQASAHAGDADGARVDVEVGGVRPDELATHQADRVGAHGARGTDGDDAASSGGDREALHRPGPAGEAGNGELGEPVRDRDLDGDSEGASDSGVAHGDRAGRVFAHDDARVGDIEPDLDRIASDQVDDGDGHEDDAGEPGDDELDPAESVPGDQSYRDHRQHHPAERGHDRGRPSGGPCEHRAQRACESRGGDNCVGDEAGAITHELGARVGEALGRRRVVGVGAQGHTACRSLGGGVSMSS